VISRILTFEITIKQNDIKTNISEHKYADLLCFPETGVDIYCYL